MKGYRDVQVVATERPLDAVARRWHSTPVCVELTPTAEPLTTFVHPEHAVYVFGPEDGHVSQAYRAQCHRFVFIPAHHCLNLAAAVNVVLAHRAMQRQAIGASDIWSPAVTEHRGAIDVPGWEGR